MAFRTVAFAAAAVALVVGGPAHAAEIKVLSTNAAQIRAA